MRTTLYALASGLLVLALGAVSASAHDADPSGSQLSQMNPQAKTFFEQGKAYANQKNWNLAVAAYQQAVRIEPKFVEAWNYMGYCYRKLKQFDKALDAYKQAMDLRPDFPNAHEYVGRAYLAMGNKDAAMREYEILKRLNAKMAGELLKAIQAGNPDLGEED